MNLPQSCESSRSPDTMERRMGWLKLKTEAEWESAWTTGSPLILTPSDCKKLRRLADGQTPPQLSAPGSGTTKDLHPRQGGAW